MTAGTNAMMKPMAISDQYMPPPIAVMDDAGEVPEYVTVALLLLTETSEMVEEAVENTAMEPPMADTGTAYACDWLLWVVA